LIGLEHSLTYWVYEYGKQLTGDGLFSFSYEEEYKIVPATKEIFASELQWLLIWASQSEFLCNLMDAMWVSDVVDAYVL
jgi:hypothetical protein